MAGLVRDFTALPDWESRYKLIIARGRALKPMPEELKSEDHKVRGCSSTVWIHASYDPPTKLVSYLDELDKLEVPAAGRALAALGPRVLRLSAERSAGAHPYLVTPEHTRQARQILGDGPLLAPEQKVVLDTDPERARAIGRPRVREPYLGLTNYLSNLRRLGWTDADFADGGSDALIDALVVHGDAAAIAGGVTAHLDAGADHVAVQVLNDDPLPALRAIAGQLQLP